MGEQMPNRRKTLFPVFLGQLATPLSGLGCDQGGLMQLSEIAPIITEQRPGGSDPPNASQQP